VLSLLVLMTSLLATSGSVLAAPADDDAADFGTRTDRITNPCDPQVPAPASAGACSTVTAGSWSFDIGWFDPGSEKYYLADRSNKGVDIVDITTDAVVGVATGFVGVVSGSNTSGPNGVVVVPKPHQLWAGDGNSHVLVYNLDKNGMPTSNSPFADINVGGMRRSDELAYDPEDQLILIANDDDLDLFVTFLSVSTSASGIKPVGQISLKSGPHNATGCGIEQSVYNARTKMFYLAVPCTSTNTNGEILVINPKTKAIANTYGLPTTGTSAGCFPHGLALGPRNNLLLGCSGDENPTGTHHPLISIVMDGTDGNILATFNQVGGSDEVWYNPVDDTYYLAASSWTTTGISGGPANPVLGIIDAGTSNSGPEGPLWTENVPTGSGAHSVAAVYATKNTNSNGTNVPQNRAYVPLRIGTTIVCKSLNTSNGCDPANTSTVTTEPGGLGVIGRIP
jgi:hypothetical protein